MEGIVRTVFEHPLVAMAICFAVLMIVYFLFKSLIKLVLILIIVAVAIGGYFYFQHPESRPANFKEAVGKAVLDKGIDKGKDAVEKGADTAGEIGKSLRGDKETGDRRKP